MATIIDPTDDLRYEVVQIKNYDNVPIRTTTDPGTGTKPTSLDAFGRQRVSTPLTLFDSAHRFQDNQLWNTSTVSGGTATFNTNQGLIDLTVGTTSGALVYRETTKVFAYQSGKSLLIMTTFVFNPAKVNLRQRVGYFGTANGMFLELDGAAGNVLTFVERTSISGSVVETKISQSSWSVDPMDGSGPSGLTLDITKAQILWMDMEWLGTGTVRMGFVINGKFILCHEFHHANSISSTYITTACLPLRYEIENTGTTASSSTLKQICSTVLSEGGYELRGNQQGLSTPITNPASLAVAGTYYPILGLRLKATRLDAIVILSALSVLGISNNANYNWQIISGGTMSGGTWTSAGTDSSVEYNMTGTSFTGGRILAQGFLSASNQASFPININKETLFKFQLERNSFTSIPFEFALVVAGSVANTSLYAAADFEEVTR